MLIAVIGNDLRQREVATLLNKNYDTLYFDGSNDFFEIKNYISVAKAVVFPYPFSRDRKTINTTEYDILKMKDAIKSDCIVFGGDIADYFKKSQTVDYGKNELFLLKNALYTAESAISLAKTNTDYSLNDLKILIIGNGRIGKYLSKILSSYCKKITVSARKENDFEYIKNHCLRSIHTNHAQNLSEFELIFNTVGQSALNASAINSIKKDALIIDLASKNSGLFREQNYIDAKALPTKYCSKSSSQALYDIIYKTLLFKHRSR